MGLSRASRGQENAQINEGTAESGIPVRPVIPSPTSSV